MSRSLKRTRSEREIRHCNLKLPVGGVASAPNCNFVYQNCRLWTGVGYLYDTCKLSRSYIVKMYSDDDGVEMADNGIVEFFYAQFAKYKWRELDISSEKKKRWVDSILDLEKDEVINLLVGDINILINVCLTEKLNYHYHFGNGIGHLLVKIPFFEATIMKGRHLTRNTYLNPNSVGMQQALWRVNVELGEKMRNLIKPLICLMIC